jgi:hypothetical protein
LQICRVSGAFQFQTIAAETWHQKTQKARNHAGIPSKIRFQTFKGIQKYILGKTKENPASRRDMLSRLLW